MDEANLDDSTFQLVMDQLEELVVTLVEEIRERPGVAVAIVAGVLGVIVGARLASRGRRASVQKRAMRRARKARNTAGLLQLGFRLLQNPIVRGLVFAAVQRQIRRRLSI